MITPNILPLYLPYLLQEITMLQTRSEIKLYMGEFFQNRPHTAPKMLDFLNNHLMKK